MEKQIIAVLLMVIFLACKTTMNQSSVSNVGKGYKSILNRDLPVLPAVKSNDPDDTIDKLITQQLLAKRFNVTNKKDMSQYLNPLYTDMFKESSKSTADQIVARNRPAVLQRLTIHAAVNTNNGLDSLAFQVTPFPLQRGKQPDFINLSKDYLQGKSIQQTIIALMDSLTTPRKNPLIF